MNRLLTLLFALAAAFSLSMPVFAQGSGTILRVGPTRTYKTPCDPTSPFQLVRATAHFDRTDELMTLNSESPTIETESICARFLQFTIGGALFNNSRYWQPGA